MVDGPAAGPAVDIADLLTQAAAEDPTRLAIVESGGRRVTWGELDDEVGRLATGLGAAGIVAGHRVMVVLGNRIEFVTTYLAVLRTQAVAVPVNPTSQAGELARMIADSGSRMVVADADTVTSVRGAVAALQGMKVLAFAGIGSPQKFFATLEGAGIDAPVRRAFGDHHRYTAREARALLQEAQRGRLTLLTTEKDLIRLRDDVAAGGLAAAAQVLPVTMRIAEAGDFERLVLGSLRRP